MKSAEEILNDIDALFILHDGIRTVSVSDAKKAMHEYAAQDRWVKVDKDNLPTEQVFAYNKYGEYLIGHIHLHNGIIVCDADETIGNYILIQPKQRAKINLLIHLDYLERLSIFDV